MREARHMAKQRREKQSLRFIFFAIMSPMIRETSQCPPSDCSPAEGLRAVVCLMLPRRAFSPEFLPREAGSWRYAALQSEYTFHAHSTAEERVYDALRRDRQSSNI